MTRYDNTPTVVVVLVPLRGGLLMVRRALPGEGYGKLALPGGYQMLGQTWQEAGHRRCWRRRVSLSLLKRCAL
jgi:ADP-ribose pyrophosphatase YjhB (NUDIX family)